MSDAGPEVLLGLLAEESRLKVVAAIVLGATTPAAVAGASGLDPKAVTKALDRLIKGGIVEAAESQNARMGAVHQAMGLLEAAVVRS